MAEFRLLGSSINWSTSDRRFVMEHQAQHFHRHLRSRKRAGQVQSAPRDFHKHSQLQKVTEPALSNNIRAVHAEFQ